MTSINLILGGTSCTLCCMEVSPSRAGGFHAPQTETHSLKIRLSATNPAAFILPGGGPLRRSVEPTRTIMAPLLRIFSRGPREILNLFGAFKALRSLSSNALVKFCQEPASCILETLCFSPVPILSLAAVHAVNLSEDQKHDVPKKCGF
jgi:hypothetical protein